MSYAVSQYQNQQDVFTQAQKQTNQLLDQYHLAIQKLYEKEQMVVRMRYENDSMKNTIQELTRERENTSLLSSSTLSSNSWGYTSRHYGDSLLKDRDISAVYSF